MAVTPPDVSIIVPCFNEQEAIPHLVRRVQALQATWDRSFELILVDDGSRDDTWLAIGQAREQYPNIVPVRHPGNRGMLAGWLSGLAASRGTYVVTIDADLQYRPEDIPPLLNKLHEDGADIAQGARCKEVERSALRRFLTAGLSVLLNLLFGMRLKDNKSGFILCRREIFKDIMETRFTYRYFQHFIAVSAHAKGYRIAQLPIVFDPRVAGESFIRNPLRYAVAALPDLPKALWEFRLRRPRRLH